MAPGELVGGAIGLTGGLIIAFLAKSVLFEFITFAGRTGGYIAIVIYIVVSIFAAYLGARVGGPGSTQVMAYVVSGIGFLARESSSRTAQMCSD